MTSDRPLHGPRNSVVIAALALVGFVVISLHSPDNALGEARGFLLGGFWMTLVIWATSLLCGSLFAVILVLGDLSRFPLSRALARIEMAFFRGTPLIAQLYLVYYGAGEISRFLDSVNLWWIFKSPISCVIIVFVFNTAAYQAYVVAGAIKALPKEQSDAARALGLSARATMLKVLLPQAMIVAIRPLANEATKMIKASAIASVVTVLDLLGTVRILFSETFDFSFFFLAACVYLVLVGLVRMALEAFERYLLRHLSLTPTASRPGKVGTPTYAA